MSQNDQILQMLKTGPITALDAAKVGCMRLAARVHDLRMQGHVITTEPVTIKGKQFARYYLMASNAALGKKEVKKLSATASKEYSNGTA